MHIKYHKLEIVRIIQPLMIYSTTKHYHQMYIYLVYLVLFLIDFTRLDSSGLIIDCLDFFVGGASTWKIKIQLCF